MKRNSNLRDRIVGVALDIIEKDGLKALTQPRLAKEVGLRQSHLTYYFPRKADLFGALLEGSHKLAMSGEASKAGDVLDVLHTLICERAHMRFFLGIIVELSEEEDLRNILAEHSRALTAEVASYFGRTSDDPVITTFIDLARGMGVRLLVSSPQSHANAIDLHKLAHKLGLRRLGKVKVGSR